MKKLFTLGVLVSGMLFPTMTLASPMTILSIKGHEVLLVEGTEVVSYYEESTKGLYVSQSVIDIEGRLVPQVQKVTSVKGDLITIESGDMFINDNTNGHYKVGDTVLVIETKDGWDIIKQDI